VDLHRQKSVLPDDFRPLKLVDIPILNLGCGAERVSIILPQEAPILIDQPIDLLFDSRIHLLDLAQVAEQVSVCF